MKKLSVCVLVCVLLLSACSITLPASQEREDRIRDREKALNGTVSNPQPSSSGSDAVDVIATTAPAQTATVPLTTAVPETKPAATGDIAVSVKFTRHYTNDGYEYATVQGLSDSGKEIWKYTTAQYPLAQLNHTSEIGRWQDRYYFDGGDAVIAMNISDGHILWENGSGTGTGPSVIGSTGNLYMTGYLGPDFVAVDSEGNTIKHVDRISSNNDYFWPCRLEVDESKGIATVYMSNGLDGYNEDNPYPLTVQFR